MKRAILMLCLAPILALGQMPTTSNMPVTADGTNHWLPALRNGNPPNLPAGTLLNGAAITTGSTLPTQTGHSGEYLTTNGTAASWAAIPPPSDVAFGSSWNGVLTIAPSKNAVYDIIHAFDTDDDGKVNVLDQAAGIPLTDANGVLIGPITDNSSNWNTAYTDRLKWDGGATGLVAATGRTSLGLVIGTDVQAYDADLTTYAGITPSANAQTILGHTFAQMRTDLSLVTGTDVQAYDADLTTWAGITPGTGVGTALAINVGSAGAFVVNNGTNTFTGTNSFAHGTITTSDPFLVTQTWNAGGVTFTGLKANITDSASASGSLLIDLQVGGVSQFSVSKAGVITSANGTLISNMTDTWNNAGTQFDAIKMNVTNTASNAASRLLELQVGSVPIHRFRIDKSYQLFNTSTDDTTYERGGMFWASNVFKVGTEKGSVGGTARDTYIVTPQRQWTFTDASGNFASPGAILTGASQYFGWVGKSHIYGGFTDGVISLYTSGENNFNRLTFGDTTASYPALKRVGTELQATLANTSAAINVAAPAADLIWIETLYARKGSGSPEGAITAPIGATYHRTDGGAGTSFYVKESGTGNTGWVAK